MPTTSRMRLIGSVVNHIPHAVGSGSKAKADHVAQENAAIGRRGGGSRVTQDLLSADIWHLGDQQGVTVASSEQLGLPA